MSFWITFGNVFALIYIIGSWIVGAIITFFIFKLVWDEFISNKKDKKRIQLEEKDKENYLIWKEEQKNE